MNWAQFQKDPVSHMCLVGAWGSILVSYTRGGCVAGSSPFTVMTNMFVIEFSEISQTFSESSSVPLVNYKSTMQKFVVNRCTYFSFNNGSVLLNNVTNRI